MRKWMCLVIECAYDRSNALGGKLLSQGSTLGLQDTHQMVVDSFSPETRPEIVATHGSGSTSQQYMLAYDVVGNGGRDVGAAFSWSPIGVLPTEFCFGTNANCPCGNGGGDCDSDQDCMPGLVCGTDNGAEFGQAVTTDVCVAP